VLLIGDAPGQEEKVQGRPFVGPTGDILRKELRRVGLEYDLFRVTNLWQHDPIPEEINWHRAQMLKEITGRKLVLLMGSAVVKELTGHNITEVNGLTLKSINKKVPSSTVLVASFNPAVVFKEGSVVGELRLAMENFAKAYEGISKR
jgi:uracil-DNA glycosylase family 4